MQEIRLQIKRRVWVTVEERVAILCLRQHVLELALLLQLLQIAAATDVLPLNIDLRVGFVVSQSSLDVCSSENQKTCLRDCDLGRAGLFSEVLLDRTAESLSVQLDDLL